WSVQLTPEADFRWCRSAGDISRALPGQALLSLSPNMPWAAPLTVSRASSSLSLASALPCWAFPSASVSLSSVTLPRPSLAWPPSLSFAFSNFSSALIANLLDRVSAQVLCATASLGRQCTGAPTCRSGRSALRRRGDGVTEPGGDRRGVRDRGADDHGERPCSPRRRSM